MIGRALTSIVAVFLTLAAVEGLLRFARLGAVALEQRALFTTFPIWQVDDRGAVRYARNAQIRIAAVYGDIVDFDITHKSNASGFLDDIEYRTPSASERTVGFVGDSFTAGSGTAVPWVTTFRQLVRPAVPTVFYNLGVGATGFMNFDALVRSLSAEGITFDELNFTFISDDLYRPSWRPDYVGDQLYFCLDPACQTKAPVSQDVRPDASRESLLTRARAIYVKAATATAEALPLHERLALYNLACEVHLRQRLHLYFDMSCARRKRFALLNRDKSPIYRQSLEAVAALARDFPKTKMRLIHLPEKQEVYDGRYGIDPSEDAKALGIEYVSLIDKCRFNVAMFYPHDAHPNPTGYRAIADCIADLKLWQSR